MANADPIADLSEAINLCSGGGAPEDIPGFRDPLIAGAAPGTLVGGRWTSLIRYQGSPGALSAVPTTSVACTNATLGGLQQATPAAGKKKRLRFITGAASQAGLLVLYDRLNHSGGLSGTATGSQSTNLPTAALPRYTDGVGVKIFLDIWSQIGATPTTITVPYTNSAGGSSTSPAQTWGGTGFREQDRMVPIDLAAGDKGARAVSAVNAVASTGTVGNFGVTMLREIAWLPVPLAGAPFFWSGLLHAGAPVDLGTDSDACLCFMWLPNGTTAPWIGFHAGFVEK